jgi:hypothetical protein
VGAANTPGGSDPWGGCWPGPQNTGYPHGVTGDTRTPVALTPYTGPTTINTCGAVIDSKLITGDLVVTTGNGTHSPDTPCVTIRNSLVTGVIHTDDTSFGPVVVTDTEIAIDGIGWWVNLGRYNMFNWRVNSHGSEAAVACADYCASYDSWVHGAYLGGAYHYNGFGSNGIEPSNGYFRIDHNWVSCGDWSGMDPAVLDDAGCSADIGFYGDFAPIQNITINRNYLAGARINPTIPRDQYRQSGYCLNPGYYPGKPNPTPINEAVTDNVFGRGYTGQCGVYGPTNSLNAIGHPNGNTWTGNQYDDGTPIDRVEE